MSYLRGPDRSEVQLLPPCLDDYVAANAPARFIDAFVEGLDFAALGFRHAQPNATGRPPYHPADLLKLYLYGYLNRIRSSRRLECEAGRNLELMWLLRGIRPDFKTIADFRKDNRAAFKGLFKQFNLLCRKLGLFGAELVAIDGSKFKAVNNPRRQCTAEELRELVQKVEEQINHYLAELDHRDEEAEGASGPPSTEALERKVALLQSQKGRYDELLAEFQAGGLQKVPTTDGGARLMKAAGGHLIGYNVQVAVDGKHDLIVAQEVVQDCNDRGQLSPMALAAKEELQVETLHAVADGGYSQHDQLQACEEAAVHTYLPDTGTTSGQSGSGKMVFSKEQFRYDAQMDVYHCPAGQVLGFKSQNHCRGKDRIIYFNRTACRHCALRRQCTSAPCRKIARRPSEAAAERTRARTAAHPEIMAARKRIVEHVIGTLRNWGHDEFLSRGLPAVRAEFSLSALTYNLRRVLNLLPLNQLLEKAHAF